MKISSLASSVHGSPTLSLSAKASAMCADGLDVIILSAGELDLSPPQVVISAAKSAMEHNKIRYTAAAGMPELRKCIANKYNEKYDADVSEENVIVTSGAKQAISNALLTIVEPGDEVIIPVPYWVSYPEMTVLARGKPVFIRTFMEDNFKLTPDVLRKKITSRTRAILLNSPSNPTGAVYTFSEIREIYDIAADAGIAVISDEVYDSIVLDGEHTSLMDFGRNVLKNGIVINGVSKKFAMTGWRLGWAIGDVETISAMSRIQAHQTSNACTVSQYAAIAALEKAGDFEKKVRNTIRKRRDIALKLLEELSGFHPVVPAGAFYIFCSVKDLLDERFPSSEKLAEFILVEALVATVPGEAFGLPGYLRISIAEKEKRIAEAIARINTKLAL